MENMRWLTKTNEIKMMAIDETMEIDDLIQVIFEDNDDKDESEKLIHQR